NYKSKAKDSLFAQIFRQQRMFGKLWKAFGVPLRERTAPGFAKAKPGAERVKKPPEAGNKPRRVSPPQRRNKIKIAISGDMRIGNRTLHPKRFDSFSKKTENLLGCSPLCQKSVAFLTVCRPWVAMRPRGGWPFSGRKGGML